MSVEELQTEVEGLKKQLAEKDAEIERLRNRVEELEASNEVSYYFFQFIL